MTNGDTVTAIYRDAADGWGSAAVVADAVHSLSDITTDLAIILTRFWTTLRRFCSCSFAGRLAACC